MAYDDYNGADNIARPENDTVEYLLGELGRTDDQLAELFKRRVGIRQEISRRFAQTQERLYGLDDRFSKYSVISGANEVSTPEPAREERARW